MDKNTLSNYGWIVVCVLVLSVMLALATPFGRFIATGFEATYTGFAHVANGEDGNRILEAAGMSANENGGSGTGSASCDHSAGNYSYEFVPNVDDGTHNITCEDCGTLIAENQAHTMIWEDYTEPNEDGYVHRRICELCRDDSGYIAPHFDNNGDGLCDVCNEIIVADLSLTVDTMGLMQVDNPMANATTYEFYVDGELKYSGSDYVINSGLDLSGCTVMVKALNSNGETVATGTISLEANNSATCDHSAGNYSVYDNGDGKSHIVVCDDCYNTVEDRANETHTDANGDDMCDVCEGMIY